MCNYVDDNTLECGCLRGFCICDTDEVSGANEMDLDLDTLLGEDSRDDFWEEDYE